MTSRRRRTALSFGLLAFLAVAVSCRDATEITVVVRTGEKCSDLSGVEIVVGPDQAQTQARFVQEYTAALTHECDATGLVGTLVVTPGGGGGTIVVAAGVRSPGGTTPDPAKCATPEGAKSCIIARRSFSFIAHTSLTLPIELDPLCLGRACDPGSTCFRGACVSASVSCNESECGLAQEIPGGTGSGNEAGSSDGAYDADLDASSFEDVVDASQDTTMVADAMPDGTDAASLPPCGTQTTGAGASGSCDPINGMGHVTPGACGTDAAAGVPSQGCCQCRCMPTGVVSCTVQSGIMSCRADCL